MDNRVVGKTFFETRVAPKTAKLRLRRLDYLATRKVAHLFCNSDYSNAKTVDGKDIPNIDDAEQRAIIMANCLKDTLKFDEIKIHKNLDQKAIKSILIDLIEKQKLDKSEQQKLTSTCFAVYWIGYW